MNHAFETILIIIAALLLVSILASKISEKFGVPSLLLFLGVGILAGSEGLGGIHFADARMANAIGTVALTFIIFSGGLDTHWSTIRPVLGQGALLSTAGVLLTALGVGGLATWVLHLSFTEGLLLGAIVSSTDAAAVFSILRSRHVSLKGRLRPLLELESGSNDPMAVFLTLGLIHILQAPAASWLELVPRFILEMGLGGLIGWIMTLGGLWIINHIKLDFEGLYPVLMLAWVLLTYSTSTLLHGNGFLAVYIAGLMIGNSKFLHKKSLKRFHEGLAWLMQITLFLTLGLLVFPSRVVPVLGGGLLVSLFLIVIARPLSTFLCLLPFKLDWREKTLIAWVGLRGAAPIILATFPLLAGLPNACLIFNVVFFIVVTSVLIQGTTIPAVAGWLGVAAPLTRKRYMPLDLEEVEGIDANLEDLLIPFNSEVVGKTIFEIGVPKDCLIVLLSKEDRFFIPNGSTRLEGGDVLFVLANARDLAELQRIIARQRPTLREPEE